MKRNIIALKLVLLAQLVFCVWPMIAWSEKNPLILIAANTREEPYQSAIKGYKEELLSKIKVDFIEFYMDQNKSPDLAMATEIKDKKPDLIFSLGGESTNAARKNTSKIPIIATLVLKKFSVKQAGNVSGVYLSYPLETQFQWLKKFFPEQRKVAIFFNPAENNATIQDARRIAGPMGIELSAIPVETPRELPDALDQLRNNIEIILAIPDEIAMSSTTAKEVLLASFRNKVPLIGLSDNWVKSGALYALSWDYDDLGRQCAAQSDTLLKGASIQSIPMEFPRKLTYTINTKIAEHMNMEISQALLKNAKLIFN